MIGRVGHDRGETLFHPVGTIGRREERRCLLVVLREEREEEADFLQRLSAIGGHEVRHAGDRAVGIRPTERIEGHVLAGYRLDDVRTGDEEV